MSDRCNEFRPGYETFPPRCNLTANHGGPRHRAYNEVWFTGAPNVAKILEEWPHDEQEAVRVPEGP